MKPNVIKHLEDKGIPYGILMSSITSPLAPEWCGTEYTIIAPIKAYPTLKEVGFRNHCNGVIEYEMKQHHIQWFKQSAKQFEKTFEMKHGRVYELRENPIGKEVRHGI